MTTYFDSDGGIKFVISVRSERPIEGCELAPHPFLYLKGGAMDNPTRAKLMEAHPHQFVFSWRRGPRRAMCENQACARREVFEPSMWSRIAVDGPALQCTVCERLGIPRHDSTFCSKSCFKSYWRQHSTARHVLSFPQKSSPQHTSHRMRPKSDSEDPINDDDPMRTNPDEYLMSYNGSGNGNGNGNLNSNDEQLKDWIPVCNDKSYTPTHEDIGCILRIDVTAIAISDGKVLAGPIVVISEPVLSAPRAPPKRALLTIAGSTSGGGTRFRVLSYNILAELYATKQAYPYCNTWNLSWPYRRSIIFTELDEAQGDIICLQEVQADHFEQHLSPFLSEKGYDGVFKQKTRESMGQYGKVDGCATFWRRSKFIMVDNYAVEFNECARHSATDLNLDETDSRKYINRLVKDNIAQIVVLEVVSRNNMLRLPRQSSQVCIANTHLYSNHQRPDVKLWQAYALMKELEHFVLQRDIALIICGDLNSEPTSAVYEYLIHGNINTIRPELDISDNNNNIRVLPELSNIVHNIELVSAMGIALGEEPTFTNFTGKFRGTLDYICYTPSRLRVMAVSSLPETADLETENGFGLPSASYASDHLMLCCDFTFAISGSGNIARVPSQQQQQQQLQQQHQQQQQQQASSTQQSRSSQKDNNRNNNTTSPPKNTKNLNGRSPALNR